MRIVHITRPGVLEIAYTWLPTWMGMNPSLVKEAEKALQDKVVGRPVTEGVLDEIHDLVIDHLCKKFPNFEGLREHLDSLKFITEGPDGTREERPAQPPA